MKFVALILFAVAAWSQPTSSTTLTFQAAETGYFPHGQRITYTGTLNSVTADTAGPTFSCTIDSSTAGEVWVRPIGYITATTTLAANSTAYTDCENLKMRVNGTDYPITVYLLVVPRGYMSATYPTATPTTPPAICTGSVTNPRYFGLYTDCPDPNRKPGGSFSFPSVGGTYTDPMGTTVTRLATGDAVYYSSINAFNHDNTLLATNLGIRRVSDGVLVISYRSDNTHNGNCWFELVPGLTNTQTCYDGNVPEYGGLGRVLRYTLPIVGSCGAFPCSQSAPSEIYRASGTNVQGYTYNYLAKGGTTGMTADGWNAWEESSRAVPGSARQGDSKVCMGDLSVPTGTSVTAYCYNNLTAGTGIQDPDYVQLAPAFDSDGRRRMIVAGTAPYTMGVFSWGPGETTLRFDGLGPVRSDSLSDGKFRPYCVIPDTGNLCVATPHASLVQNNGNAALIGDGTYGAVGTTWVLHYRLSAMGPGGGTAQKDALRWQEVGGGGGVGCHAGGYISAARLSPIAICLNYVPYNTLASKTPHSWTGASSCTAGSCSITTSAAHGMTAGQQIYIGTNNIGIAPGTTVTLATASGSNYTFTNGTTTGTGTGTAIKIETLSGGINQAIFATRYFGVLGNQYVNLGSHRACAFDYLTFPQLTISPDGSKMAWTSDNCIYYVNNILVADVGLGSPRSNDQLTGPGTTVTPVPSTTSIEFRFIAPSSSTSCTAYASTKLDLSSAASSTVASGGWRGISVTGLSSGTVYYWRVACGINEARGVVVTR